MDRFSYRFYHGSIYSYSNLNEVWEQYTGLSDAKGREVFEGDIYFEEIEEVDRDIRLFTIVVYIRERAQFGLLIYDSEYMSGVLNDEEDYSIDKTIFDRLHFWGTIKERKEELHKLLNID